MIADTSSANRQTEKKVLHTHKSHMHKSQKNKLWNNKQMFLVKLKIIESIYDFKQQKQNTHAKCNRNSNKINLKKMHCRDKLITKINESETNCENIKSKQKYDCNYKCPVCSKIIYKHLYKKNDHKWDSILYHNAKYHNFMPSAEFVEFVLKHEFDAPMKTRFVTKFKSEKYKVNDLSYVKLTKNQLLILDALMIHGGYDKKYNCEDNVFKHSEHSGMLEFDEKGLNKIIVSGRDNKRLDKEDPTIFLPENMQDAIDYEYIFHTHPPTPHPGGRSCEGIVYEFPSVGDYLHFIEHFNNGITQGSIVVAPEGIYNIRKKTFDQHKISINYKTFTHDVKKVINEIQQETLIKYNFIDEKIFFNFIAQDYSIVDKLNIVLNKYDIELDYFARISNENDNWILDDIYLPIYVSNQK